MSRAALLVTVAACGFNHGSVPPGDGAPPDLAPLDGATCKAAGIAAGGDHTCARMGDGSLYCWGRGDFGQLGVTDLLYRCLNSTVLCARTPRLIAAASPSVAIGIGTFFTCSSSGAETKCWGANTSGQYGDGGNTDSNVPATITSRPDATALDGGFAHGCSLSGGAVKCSGANNFGQVGNNATSGSVLLATEVVATGATSIALGESTSCAVTTARRATCWGRNTYKTIDQTAATKTSPTLVEAVVDVRQVAVGTDHVCAVLGNGTATCWGLNNVGQLGDGQTSGTAQPPVVVAVANVAEVSAERNHTCVRTTAGAVWCFGEGYFAKPTHILDGATALASGSEHDCAIVMDGTVQCWGVQTYGQLGNNVDTTTRTTTPQLAKICP